MPTRPWKKYACLVHESSLLSRETRIRLFMPKEFASCFPKCAKQQKKKVLNDVPKQNKWLASNAKKNVLLPQKDLRDSFHLIGHTGFRILPRYSKFETSYTPRLFEEGRNRNGLYIKRVASIYADTPVHTVEISNTYICISNFLKVILSLNGNE